MDWILSLAGIRIANELRYQVFRIYRDVRFSADQTPYKVRNGAALSVEVGSHLANAALLAPFFRRLVEVSRSPSNVLY